MLVLPAFMHAPGQVRAPFTSDAWVFELRFDGERCMAGVDAGVPGDGARVQLRGEDGADARGRYPDLVRALAALPGGAHVLDGAACRLHGRAGFALCAFDLLVHDGADITSLPLMQRKSRLSALLAGADAQWLMHVGHLPADAGLLRAMAAGGAGGPPAVVVARRKDSPYRAGASSTDWVRLVPGGTH